MLFRDMISNLCVIVESGESKRLSQSGISLNLSSLESLVVIQGHMGLVHGDFFMDSQSHFETYIMMGI